MKKVLIVDDESKIRELVRINLELVGYSCEEAEDGEIAIQKLTSFKPNLVLLDIMMPGKNGFEVLEVCKKHNIPVIFLTAKEGIQDKVKGLNLGAEDYIIKPFESLELIARVDVVLRRFNDDSQNIFEYNDVKVDFEKREVILKDKVIDLTAQEFQLLEILIQNKNLALTREKLLELAWGYEYEGDTRTVDMHVQKLRKKLEWDDVIVTVYKYGYRLEIK